MKRRYQFNNRRYETAQTITAIILLLPTIIAWIILFAYPVVEVFKLSFTSTNTITLQSKWLGLRNYTYLLKNEMFLKAFFNTVIFTICKLSLEVVLSLGLAVLLDMRVPFRKFLRVSFFAPVIVPVATAATVWMWLYDPTLGPLNEILRFLGLPTSNYIYDSSSALISIVIFAVWRGIGYDIIIFLSGLQGISEEVVEAARIDGANEWNILTKIKLPLMRSVIGFVIMMGMIGCFQAFTEADIMTQGGPNNSSMLMVNYIYNQTFGNAKLGRGAAASVLLFVVIFILTVMQKTLSRRREEMDNA